MAAGDNNGSEIMLSAKAAASWRRSGAGEIMAHGASMAACQQ